MTHEDLAAAMATVVKDYVRKAATETQNRLELRLVMVEGWLSRVQDDTLAKELGALRDRVLVVETKGAVSVLPVDVVPALLPVLERLAVAEAQIASLVSCGQDDALMKELGALHERVAVVEVRPPLPGPPGDPGPPGKDGLDGKDGDPGLAFKGIYRGDRTYEPGELVRWGGSTYHCVTTTTGVKPDATPPYTVGPEGTKDFRGVSGKDFWELFVSKGDPGKAAK